MACAVACMSALSIYILTTFRFGEKGTSASLGSRRSFSNRLFLLGKSSLWMMKLGKPLAENSRTECRRCTAASTPLRTTTTKIAQPSLKCWVIRLGFNPNFGVILEIYKFVSNWIFFVSHSDDFLDSRKQDCTQMFSHFETMKMSFSNSLKKCHGHFMEKVK